MILALRMHAMCDPCWEKTHPLGGRPYRVIHTYRAVPFLGLKWKTGPQKERCCFCGKKTRSGIYVWGEPEKIGCHGQHN